MFGLFDYTVYSFLDLSGAISHPTLKSSYSFTGQGVGQIVVLMATSQTEHNKSVEGVTLVSKINSTNGKLQIQCQQTSNIHKWLLFAYNTINKSENGAADWAKMAATLRNVCDGTGHTIRGISFDKVPDKTYASQGGMVVWDLPAAFIDSDSPNPSNVGSGLLAGLKGLIG